MELVNKSGKYSKKFEAFTGKLASLGCVDDFDYEKLLSCLDKRHAASSLVVKTPKIHNICISFFLCRRNDGSSR